MRARPSALGARACGRSSLRASSSQLASLSQKLLIAQTLIGMPTPSKRGISASRVGRPPAGDRGERVKDYPQVSFRLPKQSRDKLVALSTVRKQPQWRLIVESVECYLRDLPPQEQAQINKMVTGKRSKNS